MNSTEIIQKVIKDAPNPDWKRTAKVVAEKEFNVHVKGIMYAGRIIYAQFTEPLPQSPWRKDYVFDGFRVVSIPDAYVSETDPVLLYARKNDTWEKVIAGWVDVVSNVERNLEYAGCPKCGTLKPMDIVKRQRRGPELVLIHYRCSMCGHKDIEPFD